MLLSAERCGGVQLEPLEIESLSVRHRRCSPPGCVMFLPQAPLNLQTSHEQCMSVAGDDAVCGARKPRDYRSGPVPAETAPYTNLCKATNGWRRHQLQQQHAR